MNKEDVNSNPKKDSQIFSLSYGSDFLQDIVLQHSASDVPRELVQNEYDAGGSKMEVAFEAETLVITGNGKHIDNKGWNRLSVVLGTGTVGDSGRTVEAKTNSIGSKNLGLRSLFLFGDQIRIRSNGKVTTLDTRIGAQNKPIADTETKSKRGVRIEVPFRVQKNGRYLPFDEKAEMQAFDNFKAVLSTTLIKLARPGSHAGLRGLKVSSVRQGRTMEWIQSVKQIQTPKKLGQVFLRTVMVREIEKNGKPIPGKKVREIEFETTMKWPTTFSLNTVPSYFLVPGGRIRIAVSIPLKRKGIPNTNATGQYYYPLGANRCSTGNCISICAPFEMNTDRSDIIPLSNSERNRWLISQAIDFTWRLLIQDWIKRYGPEVYLCFINQQQPSEFADSLRKKLREEACWATRATDRRKVPVLKKATDLVIPESKELDGFLFNEHYPLGIDIPQLVNLLVKLGAKKFTMNSLIRLRCGSDIANLNTILLDTEANYYYTEYDQALKDIDRQVKFANILNANWGKLSPENKQDLKSSRSTLTDAGTLEAPSKPIWRIDNILVHQVPLPPESRLHSALAELPLFKKLCDNFDFSGWAIDIAIQTKDGRADEGSRRALYKYIISNQSILNTRAMRILRAAPVLIDHRGEWVCPKDIILRSARKALDLERALHFPHSDYSGNKDLARVFKFRTHLQGTDVVAYAKLVEHDNSLAEAFENTLLSLKLVLTPRTIQQLKDIHFLRSSLGGVAAPSGVYNKTKLNEACLGQESPFVVGSNQKFYERLGCLSEPRSSDIIKHLCTLRSNRIAPKLPTILYPTLVSMLSNERILPASLMGEPLVWVGDLYHLAKDILLGSKHRDIFFDAVPVELATESALGKSYAWLGASEIPQEHHWEKLLLWFHNRSATGYALSDHERWSLRQAYIATGDKKLPYVISPGVKCLLDQDGLLHSKSDAINGLFVINDDWALANAMKQQGCVCSFADVSDQRTLAFYKACGVKPLTRLRQKVDVQIGEVAQPLKQQWLTDVDHTLHDAAFPSALATLLRYSVQAHDDLKPATEDHIEEETRKWQNISCVKAIDISYRVGLYDCVVSARAVVKDNNIYLAAPIKRRQDVLAAVSGVVAEAFIPLELQGTQLDAVRVILDCNSPEEFQEYFAQRGIAWSVPSTVSYKHESNDSQTNVEALIEAELTDGISDLVEESGKSNLPVSTEAEEQPSQKEPNPSVPQPEYSIPAPLPPIVEVLLEEVGCDPTWSPHTTSGFGRVGVGSPHLVDAQRTAQIGRRGEELIYLHELARVKTLGYPRERVVWVSIDDPNSDHDILSVSDDGGDLFIEVKSTSGSDGWFIWPHAEFKLALKKRSKYILYRVYLADSTNPKYKPFIDPIGMLSQERLRLNIGTLSAQVEPL